MAEATVAMRRQPKVKAPKAVTVSSRPVGLPYCGGGQEERGAEQDGGACGGHHALGRNGQGQDRHKQGAGP
ncbi:hypothetical protein [Nonomuraea sp. NPDC049646]|uniref:hypothetical protein n=1 Tax=unclassified Nonomuraea TaxID=2593643 RepID=UPI0037BDD5AB